MFYTKNRKTYCFVSLLPLSIYQTRLAPHLKHSFFDANTLAPHIGHFQSPSRTSFDFFFRSRFASLFKIASSISSFFGTKSYNSDGIFCFTPRDSNKDMKSFALSASSGVKNVMLLPFLPARPVLPTRWTYSSIPPWPRCNGKS